MDNKESRETITLDKQEYLKKRIWLIACNLAIIILIIVAACLRVYSPQDTKETVKYDDNGQVIVQRDEFKNINYDGSFVVKAGENEAFTIGKEFSDNKDKTIRQFEWYEDLLCPDCRRAYSGTRDYVKSATKEGDIEVKYHILNFLPHATENNYSLILAAWITGIVEESPENFYKALDIVEEDKFIEAAVTKSDVAKAVYDEFIDKKLADKKVLDKVYYNLQKYESAVNRSSVGIRKFKKWKDLSPKEDGTFFVPFIYNVNNGTKALIGESENTEKDILQPLQGYVPCEEECN